MSVWQVCLYLSKFDRIDAFSFHMSGKQKIPINKQNCKMNTSNRKSFEGFVKIFCFLFCDERKNFVPEIMYMRSWCPRNIFFYKTRPRNCWRHKDKLIAAHTYQFTMLFLSNLYLPWRKKNVMLNNNKAMHCFLLLASIKNSQSVLIQKVFSMATHNKTFPGT